MLAPKKEIPPQRVDKETMGNSFTFVCGYATPTNLSAPNHYLYRIDWFPPSPGRGYLAGYVV